MIIFCC